MKNGTSKSDRETKYSKSQNPNSKFPTVSISFEEACRYYLTNTEVRIVKFIAGGFTCKEIAVRTGNTSSTIQTHRRNIKQKLNLIGHRSLERWCRKYMSAIEKYEI